jgi:tetratricopeptide (TPR) repeat protein
MAATAESVTGRTIRVYCVTHKVGFDAQSNRAVLCASGNHALANGFPDDSFWEYCCDCQHCWLVDTAKNEAASNECPACERQIVRRYVCSGCNVSSIESNEPGRRKLFSLSNGIPSPTCPGCLEKPSSVALEHECQDFGASFLTNFSTCPFCDDALEAPPEFPCKVSECLSNLKVPPTMLRFDVQANMLKASPTGDYVLIPRVPGINVPAVIPNAQRFESKRDYYDTYYELFNCDNPSAGEVIVLRPATVEKHDSGWQVKETGAIEIKGDIGPPLAVTAPPMVVCGNCGTAGNTSQEFCGRCGVALTPSFTIRGQRENSGQPAPTVHRASTSYPGSFVPPQEVAGGFGAVVTNPALDNLDSTYAAAAPPATTTATTTSIAPKIVLGVVAGVFLLVSVIAISLSGGGNTVEKQLDEAITKGSLFPPPTQNARDLYTQLKNGGASEETLRRYRERLVPLLTSNPNQLLNALPTVGSDEPSIDQWQEAARNLNWAAELQASDNKLKARAAYCEGRAAFIQSNKSDAAVQSWTSAANLDKAWALPINGIGLVYQSRKDYATSRSYFLRAMNLDPNWAHPYENLGNNYYYEKDYATARNYYQKALEKASDWAKPHWHLGQVAMQFNDYPTAVNEFQAALSPSAKGLKRNEADSIQKDLDRAQQKLPQTSSLNNF